MKTIKPPYFEDDSYYFIIEKHEQLAQVSVDDTPYLVAKQTAFAEQNISKDQFEPYFDRPSFRGIDEIFDLSGTIYTWSAYVKNDASLSILLHNIRRHKDFSRRCVIRMADTLVDFLDPTINTSCLSLIHYFQDSVKLIFRASDMKNELLIDLHTIKEFFIDPVFENSPEIHVIASTAQNINQNFKQYIK